MCFAGPRFNSEPRALLYYHGFSQSLKANARRYLKISHGIFLPHPSQYNHPLIQLYIAYAVDKALSNKLRIVRTYMT
jgi:hypothetical protein